MNIPLAMIGIVFLAAAVIGGGLKASGYEIKPITSVGGRLGLGMVGGLALVLGILASSMATTKPEMPVTAPTNESSQGRSTSSAPRTAVAPPSTSPSTSTASPSKPSVFWSGQITLDEYASSAPSKFRDLDSAPPTIRRGDGDVGAGDIESDSIEYFGYLVAPTGARTVAKWSGTTAPTREQCREAAVASGSETIEMQEGDYACVRTSQGRTALLKVTKLIGDQSLQAAVTVWDDAES